MADDLDGVAVSSSVPEYNAGNHYRVKELDPDEAGGGKDFYDGFMRKKKKDAVEGEESPEEQKPVVESNENPIPVVEQEIHDDIILSSRAQKVLDEVDKQNPTAPSEPDEPEEPAGGGHINFQA